MKIKEHIEKINSSGRKALSIFLTAGFPYKDNFVDLALNVLENGADILELGIPFSDPLADGPVIQSSSQHALDNGINMKDIFSFCEKIKAKSNKPIVLMGYANPLIKYGKKEFCIDALNSGAQGLIIPDVPLEEYDSFYTDEFKGFDKILLTTPTSSDQRIKEIDKKSSGFVYCVSITGTTGARDNFKDDTLENIKRTYSIVENKMLIGFGISKPEHIKMFAPHCDGVIVASALIKRLSEGKSIKEICMFVNELSDAC
jgi:tryptophan synthase alpha chain